MGFLQFKRAFEKDPGGSRSAASVPGLALGLAVLLGGARVNAAEPVTLDAGPDWTVTVTGQVRPRLTISSGPNFRGAASEWRENVTQRARLGVEAAASSGVGVAVQVQDVRVWGEETDPADDFQANGLDLHQALAKIPIFGELELRLGRQEFSLDEERLVGNLDFSQRARAFDGGRLAWMSANGRYSIDGIYAKVREPGTSPDGHVAPNVDGDVDFGGAHASLELSPEHELAPLYLVRIIQAPGDVRHTLGLYLRGGSQGWSYRAETYYQYGKMDGRVIGAYLAAVRAGYTLPLKEKPGIFGWAEILSGDGTPQGTFDTLYASSHRYNGEMGVFTNIPSNTRNLGLVDIGARLESGIVDALRTHVDGHWFRAATPAGNEEAALGAELDVALQWNVMDYVTLDALYGAFFPGIAMGNVLGSRPGTTLHASSLVYLTTNVQF
jgi:Alginate export